LITFGEMLVLPMSAMQSVIEEALLSDPGLERLEQGACPVCHDVRPARCPVCARTPCGLSLDP
jgi:hypothetical protein